MGDYDGGDGMCESDGWRGMVNRVRAYDRGWGLTASWEDACVSGLAIVALILFQSDYNTPH